MSLSVSLGNELLTETLSLSVNEGSGRVGIVILVKYLRLELCFAHEYRDQHEVRELLEWYAATIFLQNRGNPDNALIEPFFT